eukprot:9053500-Heterocapsa_arctica.AAC.1
MPRGSRPKRAVASPSAPRRRVRTLVGTAALIVVVTQFLSPLRAAIRQIHHGRELRTGKLNGHKTGTGVVDVVVESFLFRRLDVDSSQRRCRRSRRLEGRPRWPRRR